MPTTRTMCTALMLAMTLAGTACTRRAPKSGITSIQARIDGLTCPTCVPPLKASLTRQYQKSAIEVDDDKDTASVAFADNDKFSVAEFRDAVERVRMRVVTMRVQACGTVEASNGEKWLKAGDNRFLVRSERALPVNAPLCLDGTLDSGSTPATFQVSAFSVQGTSGS